MLHVQVNYPLEIKMNTKHDEPWTRETPSKYAAQCRRQIFARISYR